MPDVTPTVTTTTVDPNITTENKGTETKPNPQPWETVKHKIKYNDADQELSYQELIDRAQKGMGADSKYQEAAGLRKQATSALEALKSNPTEAFKLLGMDPRKWAQEYLEQMASDAMLSPEEMADRNERDELRNKARELDELKKANEEEGNKVVRDRVEKELGDKVIGALEQSGLPKTKEVVKRIAQKMIVWREAGFKQVEPKDVIDDVKKEYMDDLKALLGGAQEDQLEAFLGEESVKKLIKNRNKKIEEKQGKFGKTDKQQPSSSNKKQSKKEVQTPTEWRRELEAKYKK